MERSSRDHREGGSVLVQGTGGVSIFAIQIASALGARVIATSSSDEKLTRARDLGATDTINDRTTPDWAGAVLKMTDGRGVDVVIDVVVGDGLRDSIRAARGNGVVAVVGSSTGARLAQTREKGCREHAAASNLVSDDLAPAGRLVDPTTFPLAPAAGQALAICGRFEK